MAVSTTNNNVAYTGNGTSTSFAVTFAFFLATDLLVYVTDTSGNTVQQTLNTNYTVTGGNDSTGTVVFTVAPAAGYIIQIVRSVPYTQGDTFIDNDVLDATVWMQAIDRLSMLAQQNQFNGSRSITQPAADINSMTVLPAATSRAGKYLAFDANGNPIATVEVGSWKGTWATGTSYNIGDVIIDGAAGADTLSIYTALVAHIAGVWSTDLAANKWALVLNYVTLASNAGSAAIGTLSSTSTTSLSIGTGSTSLTTQTGKAFQVGSPIVVVDSANTANWMAGLVTAYNSATGALTFNATAVAGSGTIATWNIELAGAVNGTVGIGAYAVGTSANDIVQLNGSAQLPAVDGSQLTNLPKQVNISVRQTVIGGASTSGAPSFLSAGSGLAVNLLATATPAEIAFANGFGASGAVDYVGQYTTDQTGFWPGLTASTTNYLSVDRNPGTGALTATHSTTAPQYGLTQPSGPWQFGLIHFDGSAGSTSFSDTYGGTMAALGGGKLETGTVKFGTAALGGGTSNALNGSTDGASITVDPSLWNGAWTLEAWIYPTSVPGASYWSILGMNDTANNWLTLISGHLGMAVANNIVSGSTTVTTNAWHHVALCRDTGSSLYRVYLDGVQQTTQSSSPVFTGSTLYIGAQANGANAGTQGYIDEVRVSNTCRYPNGTTFTPPSAAFTADQPMPDWFDTVNWVMRTFSGGNYNTTVQRVYVGEALTGASTITSVTPYAYQGIYIGAWTSTLPSSGTAASASDNLGTKLKDAVFEIQNLTAELNYSTGDLVQNPALASGVPNQPVLGRTTMQVMSGGFYIPNKTTATPAAPTAANWAYRFRAKRAF